MARLYSVAWAGMDWNADGRTARLLVATDSFCKGQIARLFEHTGNNKNSTLYSSQQEINIVI